MTRMERMNHRLWIVIIILIIALIASNLAWIIYDQQFENYTEQTVTQETDRGGINRFIGGDYYGASSNND